MGKFSEISSTIKEEMKKLRDADLISEEQYETFGGRIQNQPTSNFDYHGRLVWLEARVVELEQQLSRLKKESAS